MHSDATHSTRRRRDLGSSSPITRTRPFPGLAVERIVSSGLERPSHPWPTAFGPPAPRKQRGGRSCHPFVS